MLLNYYSITEEGKTKLLTANGGGLAKVQAYGDMLYLLDFHDDLWDSSDNDDPWRTDYRLYTYNVSTRKKEIIGWLENVDIYFVVDDTVYYTAIHFSEDDEWLSLESISTETKIKVTICEEIVTAGVMDGNPVYITKSDDNYQVFSYDSSKESAEQIGNFTLETPLVGNSIYFNFTSDLICMIDPPAENDENTRMVIYGLQENRLIADYLIEDTSNLVTYEEYAIYTVANSDNDEDKRINKHIRNFRYTSLYCEFY